ncbi:MAG TPA: DNA polymerase IV [Candidatus Polarisedimenticolia bacterium]|nr:DNA polymerase IV [Candidatus Polarisedimenticolia bacterium]
MLPGRHARVILHLDMDAFYAAVETRENPALAAKPLIIGHRGRRGVVSTCSYEARAFGVRSAMPSLSAERLCPQAVWLPVRMDLYVEVSREIRSILADETPVIEPVSIDEAFLDLTGVAPDLEGGRRVAVRLKERIRAGPRLSASVGVAPNKFLAKIASDLEKPDGLVLLPIAAVPDRLWPLPVARLWGVGPRTAPRLQAAGLRTIGDLLRAPDGILVPLVGEAGAAHLRALARGEDDRPVESHREAKSVSEERTYGVDLIDPEAIDRALLARSEGVARELRRDGLVGRTVQIKVRTGDFTTWTRSLTLPSPTDLAEVIVRAARALFRERIRLGRKGVRLLGVGLSGLESAGSGQGGLFPDAAEERARRVARAADSLRERHGEGALTRARLLRPPPGAGGAAGRRAGPGGRSGGTRNVPRRGQ